MHAITTCTLPKITHNISTFNTGETSSNALEQKKPGLNRINDKIREMRSRKYCGYNLQIFFREHSLLISTRDLGMRQQSIYDCYPSLQSWMAFEKIHRPLFAESKHVDFPNNNSVSTSYNGAFCKVRSTLLFKQKKAL